MERNNSVYLFFDYARNYARVEMISFLELALWKIRMAHVPKEESENAEIYREICRCQSGADVIVENVVGFLWNGKAESRAGMSAFASRSKLSEWAPWF